MRGSSCFTSLAQGLLGQLDGPSNWYSGGCWFDPRSGHISFIEIKSWNNFYGNSLPTADLSGVVVSYWQKYGHLVLVNHLGSLPRKSVYILTDQHGKTIWAPSSEFVSSSILSWQILTAHAQPLRGARDLAFCLKVPLDSLLVWASSEGSGETAQMHRLAWTFTARIGDKYQICLTRSILVLTGP